VTAVPYVHLAHFSDPGAGYSCGLDLPEFETRVRWDADAEKFLLQAAGAVDPDLLAEQAAQVSAVVRAHGGTYAGGEVGELSQRKDKGGPGRRRKARPIWR
jgi:hypothetical protein